MHLVRCTTAVEETDNMRVVEFAEDPDFGLEVVLEFLGEFLDVDGLDGDDSPCPLLITIVSFFTLPAGR